MVCVCASLDAITDWLKLTSVPFQTALVVERGLKAVDGEGDDAGEHRRAAVDERDGHRLPLEVVVVMIVTGESDQGAEAQTQREEDLSGRVDPRLRIRQLLQLHKQTDVFNTHSALSECSQIRLFFLL